jgi:DNA-binding CsgD family transcriptional regulator
MSTVVQPIRTRLATGPRFGELRTPEATQPRRLHDLPVPTPAERLVAALADYMSGAPGAVSVEDGGDGELRLSLRISLERDASRVPLRELVARARQRLGLTAREAEVLALLAGNHTNREIADALVISVRTAEHHVAHILRKLGAPDRRAAAALVRRLAAPPPRHGALALAA